MKYLKSYTAYNPQTGEIISVFSDDGSTVELNTPSGYSVIQGKYDDVDGYIENNQFVPKPEKPSPNHIFDWTTKTWIDPRSLEDLKAEKWEEIKSIRDSKEFGGFYWNGLKFDSDSISQTRIMGAAQLAGLNPEYSVEWTLADNTAATLSAQDMIAVGTALGTHVSSLHETARVLRQQIDEATTVQQLEQISWV